MEFIQLRSWSGAGPRVQPIVPLRRSKRVRITPRVNSATSGNTTGSESSQFALFRNPHDKEILNIAIPTFCAGVLTPICTAVDTGTTGVRKMSESGSSCGWKIGYFAIKWCWNWSCCFYVHIQSLCVCSIADHT